MKIQKLQKIQTIPKIESGIHTIELDACNLKYEQVPTEMYVLGR